MFLVASSCCLLAGCVHNRDANPSTQMSQADFEKEPAGSEADPAGLHAALERAAKSRQDRLNGKLPSPSEFPFPNIEASPGRPSPDYINFYCINDHYPTYLLCQYDIKEKKYNLTNEPGWFKEALKQIRRSGSHKFPPIEWVAVLIFNREEAKHVKTWDQCYKVGAIFKASDAFDSSQELSELVVHAEMDRHPFMLDQQQPTPGEQLRWAIVERHAVTNRPTSK